MDLTILAAAVMGAVAAGGVAYVFLYPLLSGEKRVEKRQQAFAGGAGAKAGRAERAANVNRRDQVAQSLKELEDREKARHKVTLEMRVAQAGLTWSRTRFIVFSAVCAGVLGVGLMFVTKSLIGLGFGAFVGAFGLPRWYLSFLKKRRINRYLEELPNAIDVVVRGIRSGLPLNDCLRIISTEAQEPVRSEFRHMIDQQALGIPIADAVLTLYERVPVAESNFFAIVIAIQSKAGGNLSEALANLSRVLRERRKLKGKIQAMSMEAKASAAIIAALPIIVGTLTYISSPSYAELLFITLTGKIMVVISAFWMMTGCLVMRKMINFDF